MDIIVPLPPPKQKFLPEFQLFTRAVLLPIGGGASPPLPPLATPLLSYMGMANVFEIYSMDGAFDNFLSF